MKYISIISSTFNWNMISNKNKLKNKTLKLTVQISILYDNATWISRDNKPLYVPNPLWNYLQLIIIGSCQICKSVHNYTKILLHENTFARADNFWRREFSIIIFFINFRLLFFRFLFFSLLPLTVTLDR